MSHARRRLTVGTAVSHAHARLAEFKLAAPERCGTPRAIGALRLAVASLRQLRLRTQNALVSIDRESIVAVDLNTPHGRHLFAYGFCEPAARAMRLLLSPGDVVIDGGANIGLFTVLAAALVGPRGRVIACEPAPGTMALLRENVTRNRFDWVELHEVALAEESGRLELEVFAPGSGFSSFAPAQAGKGTAVDVAVTTLDELAGDTFVRTRLVKLDVEGAELRALRGAQGLLERPRPDFIIELEPGHLERQGSSLQEVQELFASASYEAYAIGANGLDPLRGVWHRPAADPNIVLRPRERKGS